jgi:hypothetical protein
MGTDLSSVNESTCALEISETAPTEKKHVRPIREAASESTVPSNGSSATVKSESAGAIDKSCSYQGAARDVNGTMQADKQLALHVPQPSSQSISVPIEIDFRELDNGRRLELIEDPEDSFKTLLAVFEGGKVHLASKVDYEGQVLVPIGRGSDGLGDIVLPRAPKPYHSTEEILSRTIHLIEACVSLPPSYLNVLAAYAPYSWFADRLQPPVYLLVTGLPQSGKTTLLEVMRLICRRSLLVGDITSAAAYDACSRFSPTLLIDENDWEVDPNSRSLRKLLRTGTSRYLVGKHLYKTQKVFGAKILSSQELPDDPALRCRCVHISMSETDRVDLRKPYDPEIVKAADDLRAALLQLRLEQYSSISRRLIPGAEQLRPRSRDLLGSLLAALPTGSIYEKSLLEFFLNVHNPATRNLLSPALQAVIAALFEFIHLWPDAGDVRVGKLAELANESLRVDGERFKLTPRKVSNLLASLGFSDRIRSSQGSLRRLDQEMVRRIHVLARDHNIMLPDLPSLRAQVRVCKLCTGGSSIMVTKSRTSAGMNTQGNPNPQL